jgi:hypothetical protein
MPREILKKQSVGHKIVGKKQRDSDTNLCLGFSKVG